MRTIIAVGMIAAASATQALAQPAPNTEGGRFSFTPVREGVLRLDVRTGQVSTCKAENNDWACTITPDERTAFDNEIGRLMSENAKLRKELSSRGASNDSDAAKVDRTKADQAKAESAKTDSAMAEAAKAEAAKAETAKAEAAKAEAVAKAEIAKAEATKAEAAKAEADAKAEASRAETAKAEAAAAAEAARVEAAKAETAKAELAKSELAAAEAAKVEAAKAEAAKVASAAKSATETAAKSEAGTNATIILNKDGKTDTTIVVPLPSDQQVAEAKSFVSRAWQQFVDAVNRWQQEAFN